MERMRYLRKMNGIEDPPPTAEEIEKLNETHDKIRAETERMQKLCQDENKADEAIDKKVIVV